MSSNPTWNAPVVLAGPGVGVLAVNALGVHGDRGVLGSVDRGGSSSGRGRRGAGGGGRGSADFGDELLVGNNCRGGRRGGSGGRGRRRRGRGRRGASFVEEPDLLGRVLSSITSPIGTDWSKERNKEKESGFKPEVGNRGWKSVPTQVYGTTYWSRAPGGKKRASVLKPVHPRSHGKQFTVTPGGKVPSRIRGAARVSLPSKRFTADHSLSGQALLGLRVGAGDDDTRDATVRSGLEPDSSRGGAEVRANGAVPLEVD